MTTEMVTPEIVEKAKRLNKIAAERQQTLAEMALAWLLKDERVSSVLVGVSSVAQLLDNLNALRHLEFEENELKEIETVLG